MWFVEHVRISGASAQSLGVDTRRPNGDDHWWDTNGKREKRISVVRGNGYIDFSREPHPLLAHDRAVGCFNPIFLMLSLERCRSVQI